MTRALTQLNLQISSAKISTYGEKVVDVFYVKDFFGHKVEHEKSSPISASAWPWPLPIPSRDSRRKERYRRGRIDLYPSAHSYSRGDYDAEDQARFSLIHHRYRRFARHRAGGREIERLEPQLVRAQQLIAWVQPQLVIGSRRSGDSAQAAAGRHEIRAQDLQDRVLQVQASGRQLYDTDQAEEGRSPRLKLRARCRSSRMPAQRAVRPAVWRLRSAPAGPSGATAIP